MITMRAGHMVLGARDCMAARGGWRGAFLGPRTPSWRRSETCPNLACVFDEYTKREAFLRKPRGKHLSREKHPTEMEDQISRLFFNCKGLPALHAPARALAQRQPEHGGLSLEKVSVKRRALLKCSMLQH